MRAWFLCFACGEGEDEHRDRGRYVEAIMNRYGVRTKTAAVDLALRYLAGQPMTAHEARAMRGAHAILESPVDVPASPVG